MTPDTEPLDVLQRSSRELLLRCSEDGVVRYLDNRARARLGLGEGERLQSRAPPGLEGRVLELLARGAVGEVEGFELSLVVEQRPATLRFAAAPYDGEVALLGSLQPEDLGRVVSRMNEALIQVVTLRRELEESHLGLVSLHEEITDQAQSLRESSELKGRIVANVSHEFRTPLHSILGLSRLLLDEADGPLSEAQAKQVRFIRQAAEDLAALVGDLLDVSRLEAGAARAQAELFSVAELFSALRGTLRPLLPSEGGVELLFDEPGDLVLETDRGKLAQILRNLIGNAIKFTLRGRCG